MAALQASVEAVGRYNARWDGDEDKPAAKRKPPAKPQRAVKAAKVAGEPAAQGRASRAKPARAPTKKS
jgi:hypothetical protein